MSAHTIYSNSPASREAFCPVSRGPILVFGPTGGTTGNGSWGMREDWPIEIGMRPTGFVRDGDPYIVAGGYPGTCTIDRCRMFEYWATKWRDSYYAPIGAAVSVDDDIYMVSANVAQGETALWLYDPRAYDWTTKSSETDGVSLPPAIDARVVFAQAGKLYLGANGIFAVYDPALDD